METSLQLGIANVTLVGKVGPQCCDGLLNIRYPPSVSGAVYEMIISVSEIIISGGSAISGPPRNDHFGHRNDHFVYSSRNRRGGPYVQESTKTLGTSLSH